MKAILSTALLAALTASATYADGLHVETKAFHANMRLDAEKSIYNEDGSPAVVNGVSSAYFNTAGFGVSAVQNIDEILDFGLGLSYARYYPENSVTIDQTVLHGFSRINLVATESSKVYMLAGLSRQQLAQQIEDNGFISHKSRFTPLVNGDLGLGGSIQFGTAELGLEYKYSNTLAAGRASIQSATRIQTRLATPQIHREKNKLKDVVLEGQELALTVGVKL
jgi:hypothetical protein